jgi:putative membrane protein
MMDYYVYDYGYAPHHSGFDMVIAVLCWVAVITFVVFLVKRFGRCHGKHRGHFYGNSALDILKERYARGEIEKKEFEEKKKDLAE